MFFVIYFLLMLSVSLSLGSQFSESYFEDGGENRYQLNFSWPIDDVLQLPSQGVTWDLNSTRFPPNPDGIRWIFSLTSPENGSQADSKVFLALRLKQFPANYSYLLASAKCGIEDVNGNLKHIDKTGKNVLLTPFSLRFDPFVYRKLLVEDNTLLRAPNGTLVVDCRIDGVFKEHIVSRRVRHNGQVRTSMYPSRLDLLSQSSEVDADGNFKFNMTYEVDEFEEWPLIYSSGDACFNGSRNAIFQWQFRSHNPSNNHYPLYIWFGFAPNNLNSFSASTNCGLMNSNGHKVFSQAVRVNSTGSLSFFEFPRFINCDWFETRKPVLMPDGLLKVNCVFEGTFLLNRNILETLTDRDLVDCTN